MSAWQAVREEITQAITNFRSGQTGAPEAYVDACIGRLQRVLANHDSAAADFTRALDPARLELVKVDAEVKRLLADIRAAEYMFQRAQGKQERDQLAARIESLTDAVQKPLQRKYYLETQKGKKA